MNPLLPFHSLEAPDDRGRLLSDYWEMSPRELEETHDYIQWMFPTWVASRFNPSAPILDEEVWEAFHASQVLRDRLRRSLDRMLDFYELPIDAESGTIELSSCMNGRCERWLLPGNHNLLRITRILSSTHTLGLPETSQVLCWALVSMAPFFPTAITPEVLRHWRDAARLPKD